MGGDVAEALIGKVCRAMCLGGCVMGLSVALGVGRGVAQAPAAAATPGVSTMTTPAVAGELTVPSTQLTPEQVKMLQGRMADWPGLRHYREENRTLGAPKAGERRVVFFGDSITDAWGRQHGHFFPDRPWVNRGISGQTTPQMLIRFRPDVLELHPEAVVILAGINDIAGNTGAEPIEEIEGNFRSMVELAEAEHVRVVLSSVLPAAKFPWRPGTDPRDEVAALNAFLERLAAEHHAVYLNYFPAMAGPQRGMRTELTIDGIHPNNAGYAVMEPMAQAAVEKALAQPRP